jgi:hypothetical protein
VGEWHARSAQEFTFALNFTADTSGYGGCARGC